MKVCFVYLSTDPKCTYQFNKGKRLAHKTYPLTFYGKLYFGVSWYFLMFKNDCCSREEFYFGPLKFYDTSFVIILKKVTSGTLRSSHLEVPPFFFISHPTRPVSFLFRLLGFYNQHFWEKLL